MSTTINVPGGDQNAQFVLAAGATFLAVDAVLVGLRFYTRSVQVTHIGSDDWLSLTSLLFLVGLSSCFIVGVQRELLGYPITPDKYTRMQQLEFAFQAMQVLSVGFSKLSFIFFYRRIFVPNRTRGVFHWATVAAAALVSMWMTATFLTYVFDCGAHFTDIWASKKVQAQNCLKGLEAENAVAISDFLTDIIVFVLPIPMVLRLHMTAQRKISVLLVFGMGVVAVVASIVRMVVYVRATAAESTGKGVQGLDEDLLITRGLYWAMIEAGLALTACCLPALSTLVRHQTVESAIRSARSVLSLKTGSSRESGRSDLSDVESQHVNHSETGIYGADGNTNTYVLSDVPSLPKPHGDSDSNIYVNHTVEQQESRPSQT